ncbi:TetR/AcrR family transcriptional regulator, partial [Fulvivirga lutimaris]|uniref:TetR/AcrR family transcriptional regulator n=1 Tax=Fulvivirga lutimaris TaxID=1819566 RepID=UPI0012BC2A9E
DKIIAEARSLVLKNGFSGTSIDQILDRTGITKGAFFYHFKTKNILAKALIEDFANEDLGYMRKSLEMVNEKYDKPLDKLLAFIQYFIDMMSGLTEAYPGCLYISYTSEPNQFDEEIKEVVSGTILIWRNTMMKLLEDTVEDLGIKPGVDLQSLADHLFIVFEGSFVVSQALEDKDLIANQIKHYKHYLEVLFKKA